MLGSWGGDPRLLRRPGPRHRPAFVNLALQLQCLADTQQCTLEWSPHESRSWPCLMPQGEGGGCGGGPGKTPVLENPPHAASSPTVAAHFLGFSTSCYNTNLPLFLGGAAHFGLLPVGLRLPGPFILCRQVGGKVEGTGGQHQPHFWASSWSCCQLLLTSLSLIRRGFAPCIPSTARALPGVPVAFLC